VENQVAPRDLVLVDGEVGVQFARELLEPAVRRGVQGRVPSVVMDPYRPDVGERIRRDLP
jgi:hypothetical protein